MIRLCAPAFDADDLRRVHQVLESGQLVQGAFVAELERALAARLGGSAVACQSGTAALYLSLQAVGVGPGDEVVMPALTWPSAANCIAALGARPVFVDVDAELLNATPDALLAAVGPRTRAVIPIHQFGIPADVRPLAQALDGSGVAVVEDAACAIGTTLSDGAEAGSVGTLACFSFHPRKVVTTGEGGAVVTRDPALDTKLRILRNHGQDPARDLDRFTEIGLNFRMPELAAALGIGQLAQLDAILARRRAVGRAYIAALREVPGIRVPAGVQLAGNNFQSFVVDVGSADRRVAAMRACAAAEVQTTIGTYAVTAQPAFARFGADPHNTPVALAASHHLMTLPLHQDMPMSDVDRVVAVLAEVLA
ncbi:MAG: DegT/DnrJ/EryC1/StrS family aminotransferase [Myxococcales bacterium]|nr:DegT/DnrJ/EryC1/StrS family aminotransferase [Myxococcales bacterium]MCB9521658.1 DegT/DnrJ/EryC1/StrS family aminotransferase [Myxococcales bacterium]MCB9533759.1 DegT/DnrJ/EryC1/StrS family aminotransferase [Myxococcales bacterium]